MLGVVPEYYIANWGGRLERFQNIWEQIWPLEATVVLWDRHANNDNVDSSFIENYVPVVAIFQPVLRWLGDQTTGILITKLLAFLKINLHANICLTMYYIYIFPFN